jgi:hypothetical protein
MPIWRVEVVGIDIYGRQVQSAFLWSIAPVYSELLRSKRLDEAGDIARPLRRCLFQLISSLPSEDRWVICV